MSGLVGMDVTEVHRMGASLKSQGGVLNEVVSNINHLVEQLRNHWDGPDSQEFVGWWEGGHGAALLHVAEAVSGLGQAAMNNAADQARASGGTGGGASSGGGSNAAAAGTAIGASAFLTAARNRWFYEHRDGFTAGKPALPAYWAAEFPGLPWALAQGHVQALRLAGSTSQEQSAWWSGLTSARRQAMTVAYPELLLGLSGLPVGVTQAASAQFKDMKQADVEALVQDQSSSVSAKIGYVKLDAGTEAKVITFGDGHAEVVLEGSAGVGVVGGNSAHGEGAEASAGLSGGLATTYTFRSAAGAQSFLDGLRQESRLGGDPAGYLSGFSVNETRQVAHLEVQDGATVEIGGAKVSVQGAVGAEFDLKNSHTTMYVDVSADASAGHGSATAGIDGRVALEFDQNHHVVAATVTGTASAAGGVSVAALVKDLSGHELASGSASATVGTQVSFTSSLNLQDPSVQRGLQLVLADPGSASAIRDVLNSSATQIEVSSTSIASSAFELGAVSGQSSTSTVATSVVYARPSHGPWVDVTPGHTAAVQQ